jgi:lipopolysaccharide transport system ATP-binding protein
MEQVSKEHGRTVLFVSHNLSAVRQLCTKAMLIKGGTLAEIGAVAEVCVSYLQAQDASLGSGHTRLDHDQVSRCGEGSARITSLELVRASGVVNASFLFGEPIRLRISVQASRMLRRYIVGFSLNTVDGYVLVCSNHYDSLDPDALLEGTHVFTCLADGLWLAPGRYAITLAVTSGDHHGPIDFIRTAAFFEVAPLAFRANRETQYLLDARPGSIRRPNQWSKVTVEGEEQRGISAGVRGVW